nr:putative ribonuclease H-like domain-containing protein [Tanacetum cinerariifolium]
MWKPKSPTGKVNPNLIEIFLFIVDSGCSKHMTGNLKLLINFVEKFMGTVKFGNDQIAPILGYGDLVQGAVTIKRVYYVEGLNHNLFFVGQFCDADLEVAFRKSTCFIRDLKGNDLFIGKAKRNSFHTKLIPSSKRRLQLLHIDLCGPMRVASINGKIYVLVIVDDYSRYTWTHFLRSKDETPKVLIDFLRLIQRGLQAQVRVVQTDKGMEFLNQTLHAYFAAEGIHHQTSVARTPEQNGVVERRNHTLVEAARTMLSAAKVPLFFWDEAIATACFTQNCSLVIPRYEKTPYHIINDRKPSVKFFHIFGSVCYIVRDKENLDKMKEKETYTENDQVTDDEFINIFSTPTKDHPLEQVIGNPSQSVRTRRQLELDAKICMFVLNVSQTKPKNIKEAMVDSAWIESMQEELHQFDR